MTQNSYLATASKKAISTIIILIVLILLVSGWLWWKYIFLNPSRTFWTMISNNLTTDSVTRHAVQTASGQTSDQYNTLAFGAVNASHTLVTVTQSGSSGDTSVKSETVGTVSTDYSRYLGIKTNQKTASGKPIDSSKILGIWGQSDPKNPNEPPQYFQQSSLGLVLFGKLSSSDRAALLNLIKSKDVYDITSATPTSGKVNGRSVYLYNVKISPQAYVDTVVQYAKDMGLGDLGLDPSQYASAQPIQATFTVDKLSRQLVKINYSGTQTETYSAQGLEQPVSVPTKTISITDLQSLVQKTLQ